MSSTILSPTVGQPDRFPTTFFIILERGTGEREERKKKNNLFQDTTLSNINRQTSQECCRGGGHGLSQSAAYPDSAHPSSPIQSPASESGTSKWWLTHVHTHACTHTHTLKPRKTWVWIGLSTSASCCEILDKSLTSLVFPPKKQQQKQPSHKTGFATEKIATCQRFFRCLNEILKRKVPHVSQILRGYCFPSQKLLSLPYWPPKGLQFLAATIQNSILSCVVS